MISVVVITKNEADRLIGCLESVKWADEIVVIDEGSTDNTIEIAKKYTDKIFIETDSDFSVRRNLGMKKSSGEWVLYVDADERVLAPLRDEIQQIVEQNTLSAVALSRINIIFGQEKRYGPFWPDWMIRLLKRQDFENWIGKVHEYAKFKGQLGYSKHSLLHLTHRDVDQIVLKSLTWSKIDAQLRLDAKHPPMSGWRFLRIFFTEIYKQGIVRRGFFAGTVGVMDSLLQVFSLFMTYVRLWQLQQPKPLDKAYDELDKKLIEDKFNYS